MNRLIMVLVAIFLLFFLFLPLGVIITSAFQNGWALYVAAITNPDTQHAMMLTAWVAAIAVCINTLFGVAVAWLMTHTQLRGKPVWMAIVDLPFTISPVVAGLMLVLIFGRKGWLGPWLATHDWQVIFAPPGIVLATCFVTLPMVARVLIPLMQSQGSQEEEAGYLLGGRGWQLFFRITLPKIKWGVLYGVLLATGRAVGEFGAVSVVSGHIVGKTNTVSLHIERLYNEYQFGAAFSVSTVLVSMGIITLIVHPIMKRKTQSVGTKGSS